MKLLSSGHSPVALLLLGWSPALAQGQVWIVDDDGGAGVDFTDIALAVAGSAAEDVILVRAGDYGPLALDAPRTIVAEAGALVASQELVVSSLSPGEVVLVRGIAFSSSERPLGVLPNEGLAWFEDCSFVNTHSAGPAGNVAAAEVLGATATFVRSTFQGGMSSSTTGGFQGAGLLAEGSASVHVEDCDVRGGAGTTHADGAPGLYLEGSFAFASGSIFTGGDGGAVSSGCCAFFGGTGSGGNGGPAVWLVGALLSDRGSQLLAGAAGAGGSCPVCPPGAAGTWLKLSAGATYVDLPCVARSLAAEAPASQGGAVHITVSGLAGDIFLLGAARNPTAQYVPELGTLLLEQPPPVPVLLGVLPASGELLLSFPIGELTAGAQVFYGQALFLVSGSGVLSSGSAVVLLDAAF